MIILTHSTQTQIWPFYVFFGILALSYNPILPKNLENFSKSIFYLPNLLFITKFIYWISKYSVSYCKGKILDDLFVRQSPAAITAGDLPKNSGGPAE